MLGNTVAFFVAELGMTIVCGIEIPKETIANAVKLNEIAHHMGTNHHIVNSAQREIALGFLSRCLVRAKHHVGFCLCGSICSLHPIAVFASFGRSGNAVFLHHLQNVAARKAF